MGNVTKHQPGFGLTKYSYSQQELVIGNGKSPGNEHWNGKIIYKWLIFHCHIDMICLSEGNYRGVLLGWPGCTGLFLIFFGHQQTQVADQKWTFWDHIALAFLPLEKQNC